MAFHLFGRLPPEIRAMVWEQALPDARVYEVLDVPGARQTMAAAAGLMFAQAHDTPPPALAAVCIEARRLVLARYRPLRLGTTTKHVDLTRDLLLLEPYLLRRRLLRTLRFLGRIPLVRDSLVTLALGTSYGAHTGEVCHPVLGRLAPACTARLLAALGRFVRLRTLLFVVHQEFQFETPTSSTSVSEGGEEEDGEGGRHAKMAAHPQIIHQAYRFQFDIEASINRQPRRRPHLNELLYYPLEHGSTTASADTPDSDDDWDMLLRGAAATIAAGGSLSDDAADCDPWPTNDEWRRFKRRFQRSVVAAVVGGGGGSDDQKQRHRCGSGDSSSSSSCGDSSSCGGYGYSGYSGHNNYHHYTPYAGPQDYLDSGRLHGGRAGSVAGGRRGDRRLQRQCVRRHNLPAIKGASLLWRYLRE
ncbi:hypothetical protein CMQ_341 [Grosmannia clavigera kw1407]|uniref:2EXR domain-containing protein n=1 Tax=Grosmannia clavigera (strain kw1407 / UAMH 11150) TaxID=655863 RepID=F0XR64_GROCL|nr:uncharacterized protein CMQ_341 [Grosmannia clavigera kw1407]EFX00024.1 hypothetical protein CMQ_341 [Grosmannia clavigera kw1407]